MVLSIVVGLLVLVIVVGGIVTWRRLHPDSNGECIFYIFADCFDIAFGKSALLFQVTTFQKQLNVKKIRLSCEVLPWDLNDMTKLCRLER